MRSENTPAAVPEGEGATAAGAVPDPRNLLDAIRDAVIAIDTAGLVTYWGPGAQDLYGLAAAEMLGRPLDASHAYRWPSQREEQEAWATLERTGRWSGGNVHVLRSGAERHVDSSVTVLRDAAGRRCGLLAVIRDRTAEVEHARALREAEEALRAGEQQARQRAADVETILGTIPAAVWIARDPQGDHIEANRFGAELLRRRQGENVSVTAPADEGPRNFAVLRDGRPMSAAELPVQRAARLGEEVRDAAIDILFEDGELRHLVGNASPLRGADGAPTGSIGAFVDVTDRVEAEAALRRSEERLRLALRAGRVGIWEYDLRRGSVEWSDETYQLMGAPPGGFAGTARAYLDHVHPEDVAGVQARLAAVLEGRDEVYTHEYRIQRPDGAIRWCADMAVVVRTPDGTPVRMVGTVRDVTDERLARSVLVEADRRKTEFLAMLSHELRNPLAPIRNSITLLDKAPPGSETARRARDVLRRQADHLSRLVDDLLDLSRITHGKLTVDRVAVDARELVRRAYLDAKAVFDSRGVELVLSDSVEPLWIDADPARFAQMVGNLLHNALKFTPPRGWVQLKVQRRGACCEIAVRDSGQGVDAGDLERIFDPFEQAAPAHAGRGGLGLGLALVKRLAAAHGGSARAQSEGVGRGAEFSISLPMLPVPAPAADAGLGGRAGVEPLHIVIIEDHEDAATTLADLLGLGGHRVSIAATGASGLRKVLDERPDVVLCDVGLPDMSGHDVVRALRRDGGAAPPFAVALTGYAQPQDRAAALEAGFDAHLPKPPPLEELDALLVEAALARRGRVP